MYLFASNGSPSLKITTPDAMEDIQFENKSFSTDNEELGEWLTEQVKKVPSIRSMIRVIDMAEAEKIATEMLAKQQQALKGGVTSGNLKEAIEAQQETTPDSGTDKESVADETEGAKKATFGVGKK